MPVVYPIDLMYATMKDGIVSLGYNTRGEGVYEDFRVRYKMKAMVGDILYLELHDMYVDLNGNHRFEKNERLLPYKSKEEVGGL